MALDPKAKRIFKLVGTRVPRPDGIEKVTGRALYGADVTHPGCCSGGFCARRMPMRRS